MNFLSIIISVIFVTGCLTEEFDNFVDVNDDDSLASEDESKVLLREKRFSGNLNSICGCPTKSPLVANAKGSVNVQRKPQTIVVPRMALIRARPTKILKNRSTRKVAAKATGGRNGRHNRTRNSGSEISRSRKVKG